MFIFGLFQWNHTHSQHMKGMALNNGWISKAEVDAWLACWLSLMNRKMIFSVSVLCGFKWWLLFGVRLSELWETVLEWGAELYAVIHSSNLNQFQKMVDNQQQRSSNNSGKALSMPPAISSIVCLFITNDISFDTFKFIYYNSQACTDLASSCSGVGSHVFIISNT